MILGAFLLLASALEPGLARAQPEAPLPSAVAGVVPPRLVGEAAVQYPPGGAGDSVVVLAITVDRSGAVTDARAVSGEEPFVTRAAEAAREFRFEPATRDGRAIAAVIRFEIVFREPPKAAAEASSREPTREPGSPSRPPGAAPAIEVDVRGDRVEPAVATMNRAEVRQLPGAFGDPFRAIEALPGVTPIVSGLPYFYVRGAPPGNVGYYLDGVRVPYLFHIGLGPSVVHPGMVDRVDLYLGGYPSRFGRFAGGIVSGETAAPRPELHAEASVRLFDAGALAETGFAGGRGTVLVGGRYSYTAALLSLLAGDVVLDYRDFQVRGSYALTPKDRVSVFGFGAYDLLGERKDGVLNVLFGTEFYRTDLRYDHDFGKASTVRTAVTLGYDQSRLSEFRNATDRIAGARIEVRHPVSDTVTVRGGADGLLDAYGTSVAFYADPDDPGAARIQRLFPERRDFVVGGWSDVVLDVTRRLQVVPGARVDLFTSGGESALAVGPRVSARFAVTPKVRIVHAYGLAHQPPSFVVPLPGFTPSDLGAGLQKSFQTSAGVEVDLPEAMSASATLFHNAFFDMTDALGTTAGDPGQSFVTRSQGSAAGLEVHVRRSLSKRLGGFVSYTLSRSMRSIGRERFPSSFDRTHVVNAALGYDLGRRWRAGGRLVFYTGAPVMMPSNGLILPPREGSPERHPPFYRVDVRLEKRWRVGKSGVIAVVAEVLNATLSKERVGSRGAGGDSFPVTIPSLGVEGKF